MHLSCPQERHQAGGPLATWAEAEDEGAPHLDAQRGSVDARRSIGARRSLGARASGGGGDRVPNGVPAIAQVAPSTSPPTHAAEDSCLSLCQVRGGCCDAGTSP